VFSVQAPEYTIGAEFNCVDPGWKNTVALDLLPGRISSPSEKFVGGFVAPRIDPVGGLDLVIVRSDPPLFVRRMV
jgi:hypothetical protein